MSEVNKKRLRIFAGPNGSGKSTLFDEFSKHYNTGYFVNADNIEYTLKTKRVLDLEDFNIKATQQDLNIFLQKEDVLNFVKKAEADRHGINIEIRENLVVERSKDAHSYEGAIMAMFLREKLMEQGESFCIETVLSHPSKLQEIENAIKRGYAVYLYFVCTDATEVNISRISNRVDKGGHPVATEKVIDRYTKTLKNLYPALLLCDKAYLFDNSGDELSLIAELLEDSYLTLTVPNQKLPNWFREYVLQDAIQKK